MPGTNKPSCFAGSAQLGGQGTFAGGYRGLADARGFAFGSQQTLNLVEGLNSREMLARHAIELDSADAEARSALAHVLAGRGDYQGGLVEAKRALAMTPTCPSPTERSVLF